MVEPIYDIFDRKGQNGIIELTKQQIKIQKQQKEFNRIIALTGTIIAIIMVLTFINDMDMANDLLKLIVILGFGVVLAVLISFVKKLLKKE